MHGRSLRASRPKLLIQAKRYRNTLNPSHLANFDAACAQSDAYGMFIHTGRTGSASRDFERAAAHVRIVSGRDLLALVAGEGFNLFGRGRRPQSPPGSAQVPRISPVADVPDLKVTERSNSRLRRRRKGDMVRGLDPTTNLLPLKRTLRPEQSRPVRSHYTDGIQVVVIVDTLLVGKVTGIGREVLRTERAIISMIMIVPNLTKVNL